MAKLFLKFDQAVLKEYPLSQGVVTIGRLPDNVIQIDNPAVSGHHARISWEQDHYVIEDNNSTNGTYVNQRRINKAVLKDEDDILVGKHNLSFKDSSREEAPTEKTQAAAVVAPAMDATMMLDTKQAKEMLSQAPAPAPGTPPAAVAAKDRVGTLIVMDGKTDQPEYVLTGKLTMIGKSDMATIKLKGWFAPKAAAVINRRDGHYFIAAAEKDVKVKINEQQISGQHELADGDIVEVAKIKMTFSFND